MYAVIETGGKQYRVEFGTEIEVEHLDVDAGQSIDLDRILLVADGDQATIGNPLVEGALVRADVLRQDRGEKLIVFKYKPKARRRVKKGHRQELTVLRISEILLNGRSAAEDAEKAKAEERRQREQREEEASRQAAADQALAAKLAADAEAKANAEAEADAGKPAKKTRTRSATTGSTKAKAVAVAPTTDEPTTDEPTTDEPTTDVTASAETIESAPADEAVPGETEETAAEADSAGDDPDASRKDE